MIKSNTDRQKVPIIYYVSKPLIKFFNLPSKEDESNDWVDMKKKKLKQYYFTMILDCKCNPATTKKNIANL